MMILAAQHAHVCGDNSAQHAHVCGDNALVYLPKYALECDNNST
jgi:hypothetical protein